MKMTECRWCRKNVGIYEEDGVEKLKNHIRTIDGEATICPGSHKVVK